MRWLFLLVVSAAPAVVSCKKPTQLAAPGDAALDDAATAVSSASPLDGSAPAANLAPNTSAPIIGSNGLPTGLPETCRTLASTPPAGMIQASPTSDGRVHLAGAHGQTDCKPTDATHMACDPWSPPPGVRSHSAPWTLAMRVDNELGGGRIIYGHAVGGGPLYCYEHEPRTTRQSAKIGGDCASCKPGTTTKNDSGPKKPRR